MRRSREKILQDLDEVSRKLHGLSGTVMALVDELDPDWRKKKEAERDLTPARTSFQ